MSKRGGRLCRGCGAALAADNRQDICSPCARIEANTHGQIPMPADDFWDQEEIRKPLAERDFGRFLRAYRLVHQPAIKQAQLAAWLGITQTQISRIERGHSTAHDLQKLDRWARTLNVPERYLWFRLCPPSSAEPSDAYPTLIGARSLPTTTPTKERDDVRRRQFLKTAAGAGAATVGASLLLPVQATRSLSGRTIGDPDVDLVREMTAAFRRADNRHGGGHARTQVMSYLAKTVEPMLRDGAVRRDSVREDLFTATAELHQLAGWMAYDTGQPDPGRGHLRTALRLSQEVGDIALSGEMLAGMSHHAAFHGDSESAVDLALAARQAAKQAGLPALQAEAAVMEAHGLALRRDKQGCLAALRDAERAFAAADWGDVPDWLSYFDGAYLAAKFAHTFRDLGQPQDAEQFARRSLEMSDGYERGRLFNTALLASILADTGRVDEAAAHGTTAVEMTSAVRSVRGATYLADVARRLSPHKANAEVRTLYRQMINAGIPVEPTDRTSARRKREHM